MSAQVSPDGLYYWDGATWQTTLSHDGRTRWNGSDWVPVSGQGYVPGVSQPQSGREPTPWTLPLQYAVAAWYALSAIYAISLPFWMGGLMTQAVNQSIQRQQALNPSASPLPDNFASTMGSVMTGVLVVAAVIGVLFCIVFAVGALKRWTWVFYVVLVLLGFTVISLPLNLISAISGSSMAALSGFRMPASTYWVSIVLGIPATALFAWMLIALIKRGPWAMKRVQPVS